MRKFNKGVVEINFMANLSTAPKTYMSGLEFIHKIVVNDERDFSRIKLEEGFDFAKDIASLEALKAYLLKNKHLYYAPLIIRNSEFSHVYFNLHSAIFSNVQGENANFYRASFKGVHFYKAQFSGADLSEVTLISASHSYSWVSFHNCNFNGACIQRADLHLGHFTSSTLQGADMSYALLAGADLRYADLRRVKGLETTLGLNSALFKKTIVNEKERKIIERAKCKELFEVMDSNTN